MNLACLLLLAKLGCQGTSLNYDPQYCNSNESFQSMEIALIVWPTKDNDIDFLKKMGNVTRLVEYMTALKGVDNTRVSLIQAVSVTESRATESSEGGASMSSTAEALSCFRVSQKMINLADYIPNEETTDEGDITRADDVLSITEFGDMLDSNLTLASDDQYLVTGVGPALLSYLVNKNIPGFSVNDPGAFKLMLVLGGSIPQVFGTSRDITKACVEGFSSSAMAQTFNGNNVQLAFLLDSRVATSWDFNPLLEYTNLPARPVIRFASPGSAALSPYYGLLSILKWISCQSYESV